MPSSYVIVQPKNGCYWVPMHWVGYYDEVGTNRRHVTVWIDLPSGVATKNNNNIRTSLEDLGKTLVVIAAYPAIMVEDCLHGFHARWKKEKRGDSFDRMKSGMDYAVKTFKKTLTGSNVVGIFKVPLPFVVRGDYLKNWIADNEGSRMLYVDMVEETKDLDDNDYAEFDFDEKTVCSKSSK